MPALCQDSEKGAVHAIMGVLSSSVKPWHCAAAELIGRLIINPDNEPFLLPVIPQVNVFWNLDHSLDLAVVFTVVLLCRWIRIKLSVSQLLQVSYLHWFT